MGEDGEDREEETIGGTAWTSLFFKFPRWSNAFCSFLRENVRKILLSSAAGKRTSNQEYAGFAGNRNFKLSPRINV